MSSSNGRSGAQDPHLAAAMNDGGLDERQLAEDALHDGAKFTERIVRRIGRLNTAGRGAQPRRCEGTPLPAQRAAGGGLPGNAHRIPWYANRPLLATAVCCPVPLLPARRTARQTVDVAWNERPPAHDTLRHCDLHQRPESGGPPVDRAGIVDPLLLREASAARAAHRPILGPAVSAGALATGPRGPDGSLPTRSRPSRTRTSRRSSRSRPPRLRYGRPPRPAC